MLGFLRIKTPLSFTFKGPLISKISPENNEVPRNTEIVIEGQNFGPEVQVLIGSILCKNLQHESTTTLRCTTPTTSNKENIHVIPHFGDLSDPTLSILQHKTHPFTITSISSPSSDTMEALELTVKGKNFPTVDDTFIIIFIGNEPCQFTKVICVLSYVCIFRERAELLVFYL